MALWLRDPNRNRIINLDFVTKFYTDNNTVVLCTPDGYKNYIHFEDPGEAKLFFNNLCKEVILSN